MNSGLVVHGNCRFVAGSTDSIKIMIERIQRFRSERDWKQFHQPKDLALSLTLEAAEVLELFQWKREGEWPASDRLGEELADVLYWALLMAADGGVDLAAAFEAKMVANERKYPVEKSKGSSRKYSEHSS